METHSLGKTLILAGLLLVVVGLALMGLSRLAGGQGWRLPGDLVWRRDGFTLYFPIATCVLLSLFLSLLFWVIALMGRR